MRGRNLIKPAGHDAEIVDVVLPAPEPLLIPDNPFKKVIPVCEPSISSAEVKEVLSALNMGWISGIGPQVERLEELFAAEAGTEYAVAVSSGFAALHLALAVLDISQGDEVIIPSFTMIATANAVRSCGATPVLVDSDAERWTIAPALVEQAITDRTKAIVAVHIYGHPAETGPLSDIARRHNLWLVEDASEAHGAEYRGRRVGSLGDVAAFSMYANKMVTTGEGGMITTSNKEIAALARCLRSYGFSPERHFYHRFAGYNYKMGNLQAAIGVAQLKRFDELVEARIRNARLYREALSGIKGLVFQPELSYVKNVFWMFALLVMDDFGMTRDELRGRLARRGIETRNFFVPVHLQPVYSELYKGKQFPVSEMLMRRGLYLPSSAKLTDGEIEFIADTIAKERR